MKVKIIYETQNGTTQYVAEVMQRSFAKLGDQADLHSVRYDGHDPELAGYDALLFGAPTYEDGKLETGMKVFITRYKKDFSGYKVAVFGLGNSSFPQFCTSAKILEDWVTENNGTSVLPALKIDGFPDELKPIQDWVEKFATLAK